MTLISTPMVTNTIKFVDCCTGAEVFFRGSLPIVDGSIYRYTEVTPFPGTGGSLVTNGCYTVYQQYVEVVTYPPAPSMGVLALTGVSGCEDSLCLPCKQTLPCECPEGYTRVLDECSKDVITSAEYSGGLFLLKTGDKSQYYCDKGLRLYPDISSMTWPILGDGSSNALYSVNQNNGAGPVVNPIGGVENEVWGKGSAPCITGNTGGRLNIAGVWATGYPFNTELSFEYCITVEGTEPKQYMLGVAGDNYIKVYIDTVLAVFLDTPNNSVTIPFRYWHAFPITLAPGDHTIKLAGLNLAGLAAFAAEIYDISLSQFQASLMTPAVSATNCGTSPATLAPYIMFSTESLVGQQVANPSLPGVWTCPEGTELDLCNGIPSCKFTDTYTLTCVCYLVVPCDGTTPFVTNNADLGLYVDTFVEIDSVPYSGIVYVINLEGNTCGDSVSTTIINPIVLACDLKCYYVQNSDGILYVDSDNVLQEITSLDAKPYVKICSRVYPVVQNNSTDYIIIDLDLCTVDGCPTQCYKLVNCANPASVIYTNSDSVLPYLYGANGVVKVLGKEGCWVIQELDPEEVCDCPIDVVITSSYIDCADCIGYIAYKLTSCNNNDVIYTLTNLADYIGQVVKLDCGCYVVEQINYLPPNPQLIKLEDVFINCVECNRVYWQLDDCAGVADPIITYSDLSLYVGKTVKIENCTECWTVTSTTKHLNATTVNVVLSYDTCLDCNDDLPCQCTTLTNYGQVPRTYVYLSCDYVYEEITLNPGETSDRICSLIWYVKEYCDCFILKYTITFGETVQSQAFMVNATGDELNGYPVYELCLGEAGCNLISFNGTNWIAYDGNGNPLYMLEEILGTTCPFGNWVGADGEPIANTVIESYACNVTCNCIDLLIETSEGNIDVNFTIGYYDKNEYPVYVSADQNYLIEYDPNTGCWELYETGNPTAVVTLCNSECPAGVWSTFLPTTSVYTSTNCTVPPFSTTFLSTDYFQYFGDCQHGVCPPPVFKNTRTVTPGYNTPGCNSERYDEITCNFATIMYKTVLEKRYGIANCCPEDDEKWLLLKELIDLQALKDPNYNCPNCPCSCNSGKTKSSCNCGN